MDLKTYALAYAARGWKVFPLRPRKSTPATEDGFHSATTNIGAINDWWDTNPEYNIGIATGASGLFVIDVDGPDEIIADLRDDIEFNAALTQAFTVSTPRGGTHYYLSGEGRSSVSTFADKVDTRGAGGYVVAAPSVRADGSYEVVHAPDVLPVVPWLSEPFKRFGKGVRKPDGEIQQESQWLRDNPEAVEIGVKWLKGLVERGKVAISGHGGDNTTYLTACGALDLGLSVDTAVALLEQHWNPHCLPPWDIEDLRLKVQNAAQYGQDTNARKANVVDLSALPELSEEDARRKRYYPTILHQTRAELKDIEWLVPNLFPKQGVAFLYGPSGTYKTFLALDLAMSVATGIGANWWPDQNVVSRPVLYVIGEGQHALKRRRVDAWFSRFPVPGLEFSTQLYLVDEVPPLAVGGLWDDMLDDLVDQCGKPALIVVDTLSRAMLGLDENSAKDAATACIRLENLSRRFGCLVLVIHHTGKTVEKGLRGSGAWQANSDVVIQTEQVFPGMPVVDLWVRKQKDAESQEKPFRFSGRHAMKSLVFERDFDPDFTGETEIEPEEPWQVIQTLLDALSDGPLITPHLIASISHRHNVEIKKVRAWVNLVKEGRFASWCVDGLVWDIPSID